MDPKNLSQLDPKLREAYERVMGTPTSPPSVQAPTSNQPQAPTPQDQPMDQPQPYSSSAPAQPSQDPNQGTNFAPPQQAPQPDLPSQFAQNPEPVPEPIIQAGLQDANLPPAAEEQEQPISGFTTQQSAPLASVTPPTSAGGVSTIAYNANDSGKNKGTSNATGKMKLSPIIIVVALLVLLVIYTFVWVTIFKIKLPFLS